MKIGLMALLVCGLASSFALAETSTKLKMTTEVPPGIAIPDEVESRLGTLNSLTAFPNDATVEKLYDNLDFQRAVQAYLFAIPAVNQAAMRKALLQWGPANKTMPIWEELVFPRTVGLTFNTSTPYAWMWIDLHDGPLVAKCPRASSALSMITGTGGSWTLA